MTLVQLGLGHSWLIWPFGGRSFCHIVIARIKKLLLKNKNILEYSSLTSLKEDSFNSRPSVGVSAKIAGRDVE